MSIVALLIAGAIPVGAGAGAVDAPPREGREILLFGARWCAPCMSEYADLSTLAAAAAPDRLLLAWIDAPLPAPPALSGQVGSLPADVARRVASAVAGPGYGVPFAAMRAADGRICAVFAGRLHAATLAMLRTRCAAAGS